MAPGDLFFGKSETSLRWEGGRLRRMIGQWLGFCVWEGERDGGYELAALFFFFFFFALGNLITLDGGLLDGVAVHILVWICVVLREAEYMNVLHRVL